MYDFIHPHLAKFPQLVSNPLASIAAMFLMVYASKAAQVVVTLILYGGYNNVNPREAYSTNKHWKDAMISRAYASHQNTWEAFGGFSVAVLMAVAGKKEVPDLLLLCNAFLCVRALYIPVYIISFNTPLSAVRSSVFMVGMVIIMKIMSIAAEW